jgi:hypothetical protein
MVTAHLPYPLDDDPAQYILHVPPGIAVETAPVRDFADYRIMWRIRPLTNVRGLLRVKVPDGIAKTTIAAGTRTLSPNRRSESFPGIVTIEIDYPKATVAIAGLDLPWLAWFLIVSAASAVLFSLLKSINAKA